MKEKRAKSALPPDLTVDGDDGWCNWDFDKVPAKERAACCWWEYLRESGSARDALWVLNGDQPIHTGQKNIGALFSTGLWDTHKTDSYPTPWQLLSVRDRQELVHLRQPYSPSAFTVSDDPRLLRQLADKAQTVNKERAAKWDEFICHTATKKHVTSISLARSLLSRGSILDDNGREYVLVSINWRRSLDDIISEFSKWVRTNRPNGISPRPGRPLGKYDTEVALDGLAIMRLLRHYKPTELEANKDTFKVWERCRGHQFPTRKKAKDRFQDFFGLQEPPLSWGPTRGGRSR